MSHLFAVRDVAKGGSEVGCERAELDGAADADA